MIKEKKGVALIWAISFMLVIFAIISLLTALLISNIRSSNSLLTNIDSGNEMDQLRDCFLLMLQENREFPQGNEDFDSDEFSWMGEDMRTFFKSCQDKGYNYELNYWSDTSWANAGKPDNLYTKLIVKNSNGDPIRYIVAKKQLEYDQAGNVLRKNPKSMITFLGSSDENIYTQVNWPKTNSNVGLFQGIWNGVVGIVSDVVVKPTSYVVTLDSNGGNENMGTRRVNKGESITLPESKKSGAIFAGWTTTRDNESKLVSTDYTPTANITLYALYKPYKITLDANGGSCSTAYLEGKITSLPKPTKTNYKFACWSTEKDNPEKEVELPYVPTNDVTFYACYTEKAKYTVTLHELDSSTKTLTKYEGDDLILESRTKDSVTKDADTFTVTLNANGGNCSESSLSATSKETIDYTFRGWSNNEDSYNAEYESKYTNDADADLYPVFTPSMTTTYASVSLPEASKSGNSFDGWYTETSGGNKINSPYEVKNDITLYAHYDVLKYTLKISTSYCTVNQSSITNIPHGSKIKISSNTLTVNGVTVTATPDSNYEFDKWEGVSDGTEVTSNSITATAKCKQKSGSCVSSDTLITLANGTQKKAKDVTYGDKLLSFNHETGKYEPTDILVIVESDEELFEKCIVKFDNSSELEIINAHGLFDYSRMEYVIINKSNVKEFIGDEFVAYNPITGENEITVLTSFEIKNELDSYYSLISLRNINVIANNLLTISDEIEGLYNFFKYDADLKYNAEDRAKKIKEYGISSYDEWSEVFTYEQYKGFILDYSAIAFGEGLTTREQHIKTFLKYYDSVVIK